MFNQVGNSNSGGDGNSSIPLNSNSLQSSCIQTSNTGKINSVVSNLLKADFVFFKSPFPDEIAICTLNFLEAPELRVMDSVNKHFKMLITKKCERDCNVELLPSNISPKRWMLQFPNAMGVDFIQKYVGGVEESDRKIPIPENYVGHPLRGFNLALMTRRMIVEVDENSPIELDETTAVGNNRARLVENGERRDLPLTGNNRILIAHRTLKNLIFVFQNCLKEPFFFKLEGPHQRARQNILDQHGDADAGPSHWVYQQEEVFEPGKSYVYQNERARNAGLEIVPLIDAISFDLLTYRNTGKMPQRDYFKRTSTQTLDNNGVVQRSAIRWRASGPLFRPDFSYGFGDVGAVVGVPAGSSERPLALRTLALG